MGKRGQVFILAAILIAVILFSLAAIRNKSEQEQIRGDFEALSENYKIEASKLINSAVKQSGIDPHEAFKSFSTMFTSYAKGKNPEYGLIYILSYGDKIQVANFLDRPINIINTKCVPNYNITIPGGFGSVNANLNFEDFNIKMDIPPVGLEFDCENISNGGPEDRCDNINSLGGDIDTPENHGRYCAFLCLETDVTEVEIEVMIDGFSYPSCVRRGVPEIMQVSIMKQGKQAKVSATGDCLSKDFCRGFDNEGDCRTCSRNTCFWWQPPQPGCPGFSGACLKKSAYPNWDPTTGGCSATCDKFCVGDSIFYKDDCDPPNPIVLALNGDCESQGQVCRNAQCCTKLATKSCCGDDVCWASDCSPPTPEGTETCGTGEACRGPGAECCNLKYETRCDGNNIYYYSNCNTKEEFDRDCTTGDFDVCRDPYYTGGGDLPDEAVCCIQNFETKCFDNDVYYYSSCGTKENLKQDCGAAGCADGACVTVTYKKFQCRKTYMVYAPHYNLLDCRPQCGEGCTFTILEIGGESGNRWALCGCDCWTACSASPSCGGDTYLGQQAC